jgi:hypothetical protein
MQKIAGSTYPQNSIEQRIQALHSELLQLRPLKMAYNELHSSIQTLIEEQKRIVLASDTPQALGEVGYACDAGTTGADTNTGTGEEIRADEADEAELALGEQAARDVRELWSYGNTWLQFFMRQGVLTDARQRKDEAHHRKLRALTEDVRTLSTLILQQMQSVSAEEEAERDKAALVDEVDTLRKEAFAWRAKAEKSDQQWGGVVRWYAERAKIDQSLLVKEKTEDKKGKAEQTESMVATKIAFLRLSATWKAASERAQLQASMAAEVARERW